MATYAELRTAVEFPPLMVQVKVACLVAADTISMEVDTTTLHAARLLWAKRCYAQPDQTAQQMAWAVLIKNRSLTPAAITAVTTSQNDAAVQTAVDASVNLFATVG